MGLNKKIAHIISISGAIVVALASIQISPATVGLSGITEETGQEIQEEGTYSNTEENFGTDNETGVDADIGTNTGGEEGGVTYDPDPYSNTDETTEKNKENTALLATLMDSWEENPGGSTYTDESAYYKVGNLTDQPAVDAPSAILMDASSGFVLYNKNATEKKYPASMTKVMTAMVALKNGSLDDKITFSENAVNNIPSDATKAGFKVGDTVSLKDALCGLFMASGADAAVAIAEHYGGTEKEFVDMMNSEAQQLGCANTHFVNCHGMHDADHYTTAYDMALIMQEAISIQEFKDILGMMSCDIKNENGNIIENDIHLQNRSALLSGGNKNYFEFAKGSKTGHTNAAKYTLVSYAEKDNETLIAVVLDDEDFDKCYADHKKLYGWGYAKTQVLTPMPGKQDIEGILKSSLSDDKFEKIKLLSLKYVSGYKILTNRAISTDDVRSFFVLDEDMENGILGYLNVSYYDKILIGRTPVLYSTDDKGYQQYVESYSEIVEPNPIVITPEGSTQVDDGSDGEENGDIWGDSSTDDEGYIGLPENSGNRQENPELGMNSSIFDYVVKGFILYGVAMVILCAITWIIISIRRKQGY